MRKTTHRAPPALDGGGFSLSCTLRRIAYLTLFAAFAIAACQAGTSPTPPPATAAPTATATTAPSQSPEMTIVDDAGTPVTFAFPPQRVISLTPATSELMFALDAGDRLVGRTDYDDYPPQVTSVPAVATFQGVEMEKVVNIGPDLVLAGGNGFTSAADIQRMRELGIPVLVLYATDVPGVLADIRIVGHAVGADPQAQAIDASIQSRIDQVTSAVQSLSTPNVFYEIGNDPELYGPAPDSFVADMVSLAGGDAITTTDPTVFSMPVERLVSLDPDVIVLGDAAYQVCPDSVAARPGWGSITAVKNGAIRPVDDTIVTRPGPRIGDGLAALALAIHPDAQIAAPSNAAAYCASPAPSFSPGPS